MTSAGTPHLTFASLQYVTYAPLSTAEAPSVSVMSDAIWPLVALSIVLTCSPRAMSSRVRSAYSARICASS